MILHYIRGKRTISDWFDKIFDKYKVGKELIQIHRQTEVES